MAGTHYHAGDPGDIRPGSVHLIHKATREYAPIYSRYLVRLGHSVGAHFHTGDPDYLRPGVIESIRTLSLSPDSHSQLVKMYTK